MTRATLSDCIESWNARGYLLPGAVAELERHGLIVFDGGWRPTAAGIAAGLCGPEKCTTYVVRDGKLQAWQHTRGEG